MYYFLSLAALLSIAVKTTEGHGPWMSYQTEPTFRSSIFTIHTDEDRSMTSSGYIFLSNYVSDIKWPSFGPQIYNMDGHLIWNGNDTAYVRALDAHVCDYQGERGTHLCINDAIPVEQPGHSSGVIRFFDNSYEQVDADFAAAGDLRGPDNHELNTPRMGGRNSFLQDIYQRREFDLSMFEGRKEGYILDGCFQEIDQTTREVVFQWCALDHVDVDETFVYQNGNPKNYSTAIAGEGAKEAPWDWFHINAIDKNEEGDYLVSGRHTNTIYKIAGAHNNLGLSPGQIIWRLGGKNSDFQLSGFNFSRQHDVRFHKPSSKGESQISLFNNAFDGWAATAEWSEGQLISLDNQSMTAHIITRYESHDHRRSLSQGSVQFTQHNTTFIGWGNRPFVTEHDVNGTLLYCAQFSGQVESYRAWKFQWTGRPKTRPKVLGYARDASSLLYAYVSWNGATEVAEWALYTSGETAHGPWKFAGRVKKQGFETFVDFTELSHGNCEAEILPVPFRPFVYAEALDASGAVLGTSAVAETFIPDKYTAELYDCDETKCQRCTDMTLDQCDNAQEWFSYRPEYSQASMVQRSHAAGLRSLIFLVCAYEIMGLVVSAWLCSLNTLGCGSRGKGMRNSLREVEKKRMVGHKTALYEKGSSMARLEDLQVFLM